MEKVNKYEEFIEKRLNVDLLNHEKNREKEYENLSKL